WSVRSGSMIHHPTGSALRVSGSGPSLSWHSPRELPFSLFLSMVVPCPKRTVFPRQLGTLRFSRQRPFVLMLTSLMMRRNSAQCWIKWHRDADLPLGGSGLLIGCFDSCNLKVRCCPSRITTESGHAFS